MKGMGQSFCGFGLLPKSNEGVFLWEKRELESPRSLSRCVSTEFGELSCAATNFWSGLPKLYSGVAGSLLLCLFAGFDFDFRNVGRSVDVIVLCGANGL